MSEPTTDQVRLDYMYAYPSTPDGREIAGAEFDRWLSEHDRQVAERAWDEGRDNSPFFPTENPYRAAKGEQK